MSDNRKIYKLLIRKSNVFSEGTHTEVQLVKTNDIYHEIGYIYCNTLERIDRIDYQELQDSNGFIGGLTQIKNLTKEQIDELADKIIPIERDVWDGFLDLMFNVKQKRDAKDE